MSLLDCFYISNNKLPPDVNPYVRLFSSHFQRCPFFFLLLNLYLFLKDLGDCQALTFFWLLEKIIRLSPLTFRKGRSPLGHLHISFVCCNENWAWTAIIQTSSRHLLSCSLTHEKVLPRLAKVNVPFFLSIDLLNSTSWAVVETVDIASFWNQ